MGLLDALAPVINLVLLITYAVYVLFGLMICILGVAYMSEISGADKTAAGVCVASGLFMIITGAGAVFATLKKNWLIMFVVLIIDVILFVAMLGACMVGFAIATGVRDPVTRGVEEAFKTEKLRESAWPGIRELGKNAPLRCTSFSDSLKDAVYVKKIKDAKDGVEAVYAGNCTKASVVLGHAVAGQCEHCWLDWKQHVVTKMKDNLWPATYACFALFFFVVISICLNIFMADNYNPDEEDDDEDAADKWAPDGIVKIISLVFTGLVGLFGLLLTIFGIVAYNELSSGGGCPEGQDCTSWAVIGIVVLGLFFLILAGLNIAAVMMGGAIGKLLVRLLVLIWFVLGFVLLLVSICFAIVAGAISSINEQYDLNFAKVREQANQADDGICPTSMSDALCKTKIKTKTEDAFQIIGIVGAITCLGFLFVIYLSFQAVKIFKNDEGDDDEGDE